MGPKKSNQTNSIMFLAFDANRNESLPLGISTVAVALDFQTPKNLKQFVVVAAGNEETS